MDKRHGLWMFHRAAKRALMVGARWWVAEESEVVSRMVWNELHLWQRGYYRRCDVVIRCANRFARRFGGVRTAGDWNALCGRIAERHGLQHTGSRNATFLYDYRDKSPLVFGDQFDRPAPRHCRSWIVDRLKRIVVARRERLERLEKEAERRCRICGKESDSRGKVYLFPSSKTDPLSAIHDAIGSNFSVCFYHRMQLGKLRKVANEVNDAQRTLRRIKREGTKNHARTDGIARLHHGGCD